MTNHTNPSYNPADSDDTTDDALTVARAVRNYSASISIPPDVQAALDHAMTIPLSSILDELETLIRNAAPHTHFAPRPSNKGVVNTPEGVFFDARSPHDPT